MKDDSDRDKAIEYLVGKQLRAGLKPGGAGCPDPEILGAYVERTLAGSELRQCEAHLASCAGCLALVSELLRLSEDDDSIGVGTAALAPSRAPRTLWFRWAWAGPALVAMLVAGIWFIGDFQNSLRQPTSTQSQIRNQVANQPTTPPPPSPEEKQIFSATPGADESGKPQPQKNKALDGKAHAEMLAQRNDAAQTQTSVNGPTGAPAATTTPAFQSRRATVNAAAAPSPEMSALQTEKEEAPAPILAPAANDRVGPAPTSALATPAERAELAKTASGDGGDVGQGIGAGTSGGVAGRVAPGIQSTEQLKDERASPAPQRHAQLSAAATMAAKADATSRKSKAQDEATTARESDLNASIRSAPRDEERAKQEVSSSRSVGAVNPTVQVQSESFSPNWRVGRHGLIQKSDSNGNWQKRNSGVKTALNEITFAGPNVGWVTGNSGTILRTTDGGTTWTKVPSPTNGDLIHVTAISEKAAGVVTRSGVTFTTADGGKTWSGAGE